MKIHSHKSDMKTIKFLNVMLKAIVYFQLVGVSILKAPLLKTLNWTCG